MRRVVVTGVGLISPLGLDVPTSWNNLVQGRSGIGPVTRFEDAPIPSKIAGQVPFDFDCARYLSD
ncbi:MAG: beta-ketoacyl synthase N-terminal-like domain-containing protein, partial [Pseudomonadota bacterium]|nr:beta-ketoacyl synthase N-terminal-like domain-containing protein [Pseudomonadota bacterium]